MIRNGDFFFFLSISFLSLVCFSQHFSPAYEKVLTGEGMPLFEDSSQRGNLIISFDIQFPEKLSPERKQLIKEALSVK